MTHNTLPNGWTLKRLDQVSDVIDSLHQTPEYEPFGLPMVRVTDVKGGYIDLTYARRVSEEVFQKFTMKYEPKRGDIVFSRVGTYGLASYVATDEPFCLGQNTAVINPKLNSRYLYYALSSQFTKSQIERLVVGSTQKTISLANICGLRIPVAGDGEIGAIAHILGSLDDKIELNRRMNETLEAKARAIFKSWFVDFDPVSAKMEGHQPPGMDTETAALFPDSFEDLPLGKIPKGWRAVSLSDVIDVNPKRSLKKGEIAPYLDMKNMPTRGHYPDEVYPREFGSGTKFCNGDTLVARITPCLENGKTAFVDFLREGEVGWGSTEYIVLRPKPPLPELFAYYLGRCDEFRSFAIQNMTGSSGRQRVPADSLDQFMIPNPTEDVGQAFGDLVSPLAKMVRQNCEQMRTVAEIRDVLLPKLLSGEIRVKDAEKLAERVT